ncbi:MAG TPA: acyl-CoA dehydrogenase family protein [Aliidongia sp.]|nr:acyl-CoA dehydrogenase family protein [Aliidongia sp.]
MISFQLDEEQELIRDSLEGFAREVLRPQARAIDEAGAIPDEILAQGWELGLVAATIPEEYGGSGGTRSPMTGAIMLEQLGGGCASLASAVMASSTFVNPLLDFGTDEQKRDYLPLFAGPEPHYASLALQESQFGFGADRLRTKAERRGNGWVLSGTKRLVPFGDRASHFLVLATGGEAIDAFIVPRDAKGLAIEPEAGTMGLKPLPTAKLSLDRVELPGGARLGGDNGIDAARLLNTLRVASAAIAVGISRTVTDFAIPYAKERVAFGEPIAKKQAIAFMLADMHIECDTMRLMVWKAASQLDQGADATRATVLAQDYVRRHAVKVADDGLQIFGGHGFIRDLPLEMWLRNTRTVTVLDGPAAV